MRHARHVRRSVGLGALAVGLWASAGCTHNYYYYDPCLGGPAAAPAAVVPGTVQYGSVCEVPGAGASGGTVVASPSVVTPAPVAGRPRPPRVVVSEPNGPSRFAWRRSDPDAGLATTRVEGAVEDPTLSR